MLTEYEARKLQEDMKRELNGSPALVLGSLAGLLIVLAFGLIGSTANLDRDPDRGSQDAAERRDRPFAAEVTEQSAGGGQERFQSLSATGVGQGRPQQPLSGNARDASAHSPALLESD